MKHNICKNLISLILCFAILFAQFALTASAIQGERNENIPIIHVPGIMSSDIYEEKSNPESRVVWPPSTESILKLVADCVPGLMEFAITKNWEKLGNTIVPLANEFFADSLCAPDGSIPNTSGPIFQYPTIEELEENSETTFIYDWRADPLDTAILLNDYIDYIITATGSDKVSIECHSLGSIITMSYCSIYGSEKIDGIVFNSAAVNGVSYTGDLLSGDMVLSNDSIMAFMGFAFDAMEQEKLLTGIFDILEKAGLVELVADLGNTILENLSHILLPQVVVPLFARWLTIWAMVPDDKIDVAVDYTFTYYMPEYCDECEILREKIERYNCVVRDNKAKTLEELDENCKIGVISRYGYSSIPATSSWQNISDGIVDSKYSSFGATFALYGSTLDENIIANTPEEFISPDKTVNAATCIFPDKTWFIKNTKHSNVYNDLDNLIYTILRSEDEITVNTYEEYPRYLAYDYETDSILPEKADEISENGSWLTEFINKIKSFFSDVLKKFRDFFGLINT